MTLQFHILKLHGVQPLIEPVTPQEILMRSDFDDPASIEHDDPIGILNGRQPMRNDESRTIFHKIGQRQLHDALGLRVQGRCCFIQNQERRVAQDRSRDGQPLSLAAR